LHNVEKHAGASTTILTLHYDEAAVEVVVQDDGRGLPVDFRVQSTPRSGRAWGLTSLQQRVEQLGGGLLLVSNEDGGATLRARIPANRGS
jgi:signal transduction histidine kinase